MHKLTKVLALLFVLLLFFITGCEAPSSPQTPNTPNNPGVTQPGNNQQPSGDPQDSTSQPSGDQPNPSQSQPGQSTTLSGNVSVHFIDVGQGDSILIKAPGKTVLIDGGPRSAGSTVVSYLRLQGVTTIDLLISTHPHEDHIGGLIDVLGSFTVKEIIDPGVVHTTKTFEDYLDLIDSKNIAFTEAKPGLTRDLGGTAQLQVIHPSNPSSSNLNDASVVSRLTFGSTSFLFAGDAESASESQMLKSSYTLASTVLKIGHHGSKSSSTQAFLTKINPKHAVICVGTGNSYEHPHKETLDRLKTQGVSTYRTDLNGNIVFTSDGKAVTVKTGKTANSTAIFAAPQPAAVSVGSISISPGNQSVANKSSSLSVKATISPSDAASKNVTWKSSASWITIPGSSASGAAITVNIAANPGTSSRKGTITATADGKSASITITQAAASAQSKGKYVGSIKSDKYHSPSCTHAKKILPENEIWFADVKAAKDAGYVPCGVCKPPSN